MLLTLTTTHNPINTPCLSELLLNTATAVDAYRAPAGNLNRALFLSASLTFWVAAAQLPNRFTAKLRQLVGLGATGLIFTVLAHLYIETTNMVHFFLIYEAFLLPSAAVVWVTSPNKRGVRASLYFVIWTQAGSALVLGGLVVAAVTNQTYCFDSLTNLNSLACTLLIVGFGTKIPLFPFYFWLTKTHVEAITSFSIFLSGFLVKLAVVGLWKFYPFMPYNVHCVLAAVAVLTVLLASVAFIYQSDYKKLIAYATIQEMGILATLYILTSESGPNPSAKLLVVHTVLSALFFSIADMLYRRYTTRSLMLIKGALTAAPLLYCTILGALLLFKGLPLSMKFVVEYTLLNALLSLSTPLTLLLAAGVVFAGNLFFALVHFKCFFAATPRPIKDITLKEGLTLGFLNAMLLLNLINLC